MGRPMGPGPHRHRARRGALRASILGLLAERPMHGYELITELEDRTRGRWRPSPGSIYPALAQLEDEGLVRSSDDDGRKRFELTDAGRERLAEQDTAAGAPWERSGLGGHGDALLRTARVEEGQVGHRRPDDDAHDAVDHAGGDEVAVHASFFPQLEDLGGEVLVTPAQAAALELLEAMTGGEEDPDDV